MITNQDLLKINEITNNLLIHMIKKLTEALQEFSGDDRQPILRHVRQTLPWPDVSKLQCQVLYQTPNKQHRDKQRAGRFSIQHFGERSCNVGSVGGVGDQVVNKAGHLRAVLDTVDPVKCVLYLGQRVGQCDILHLLFLRPGVLLSGGTRLGAGRGSRLGAGFLFHLISQIRWQSFSVAIAAIDRRHNGQLVGTQLFSNTF